MEFKKKKRRKLTTEKNKNFTKKEQLLYDYDCCLEYQIYNIQSTRPLNSTQKRGNSKHSTTNDYYLPKKMLSC